MRQENRLTDKKPVSLAPLDVQKALEGLLAIPDPEATKPKKKKPKRKKAPPPKRG
jgi:hypothetical protein